MSCRVEVKHIGGREAVLELFVYMLLIHHGVPYS